MIDKIIAITSLLMLIGFMSIVASYINEPDLWVVVVIVLVMAVYDFWRTFRSNGNKRAG